MLIKWELCKSNRIKVEVVVVKVIVVIVFGRRI